MSKDQQAPAAKDGRLASNRILRGLIGLAIIAGSTAAIVSLVEQLTRDQIAANQSARVLQIVADVLPRGAYNNKPHQDIVLFSDTAVEGNTQELPAYRARWDNTPVALALTVEAPDGYVAPIRLLVGIDSTGRVTAIRTLQHLETPGLGDQIDIDKSDWLAQFAGRRLSPNPTSLTLRRDGGDLDHISGATITSRAVSKAVSNALRYYEENRVTLFAPDTRSDSATPAP
jgi:electron transport complex protein RnfG